MVNDPPQTPTKTAKRGPNSVDVWAVQCGQCYKWRTVETPEEYEEIRRNFTQDPFVCAKKPNQTCEDPADITYDASRTWVIDKPDLPKTPDGFTKVLTMRKDYSKMDIHYTTPTRKRLRSSIQVASFLKENPEFSNLSVADFSFKTPKVMEDTIPASAAAASSKKGPGSISGAK
ncbi:PREDICTED: methyl-CpG-binding domain-containing protein 4-like [Ipomoea nil]|uniref:methyl-CpG-binding domain-containing protein 4-like n=1 Tax=Ipomoea nil TaxID=35883 RepID=UPI0009018585|nr:PREDICTED: methyl-CpG-binding domain-containing protein 4-like [Ipomoea nil]